MALPLVMFCGVDRLKLAIDVSAVYVFFFFQAEDGIRDYKVTGVQTCALPILHTAPNPHPRFDAARCFGELVADLAGGRFGGLANRLERFAATYACRAAIKAGQRLEPDEMRELVARLLTATLPAHDVHGRPTVVQLPKEELERRFGGGFNAEGGNRNVEFQGRVVLRTAPAFTLRTSHSAFRPPMLTSLPLTPA